MELYSYEKLSALIGEQVFVCDDTGNKVSLVVSDVVKNKIDSDQWEGFSVIYHGDKNFRIPQGTYTFNHSGFGEKKLFLTPNGETEYETVITRKRVVPIEETCA